MRCSLRTWVIMICVAAVVAGAAAYLTVAKRKSESPDRRAYRIADLSAKVDSSRAVLAYLRSPGRASLEAALKACLAVRERAPGDVFNGFLTAFCYHELKDSAGEERALSIFRPEQKNIYRFCFYEHRDELADALYFLPAYFCSKLRDSPTAWRSFPPGAKCPFFGGEIVNRPRMRGNIAIDRFLCPKCDGMIELGEREFLGNIIFHRVKKENILVSILPAIAADLEDRRRFKSERRGTVQAIVSALDIKEGQVIADIGCGVGQFTFPFAVKTGPKGKVYAEDIDAGMIKLLKYCVDKGGPANIAPVLGAPDDIKIPPGSLDIATLIHVYRSIRMGMDEKGPEYLEPFFDAFFGRISASLRDGGVLFVVDHLDPRFDITPGQTAEALKKRGFSLAADKSGPKTMILLFKKDAQPARTKDRQGATR